MLKTVIELATTSLQLATDHRLFPLNRYLELCRRKPYFSRSYYYLRTLWLVDCSCIVARRIQFSVAKCIDPSVLKCNATENASNSSLAYICRNPWRVPIKRLHCSPAHQHLAPGLRSVHSICKGRNGGNDSLPSYSFSDSSNERWLFQDANSLSSSSKE